MGFWGRITSYNVCYTKLLRDESTNSGANVLDLQAIGSVKPGAIAYGGYADGEPSTNVLWAGVSNTVYLRASDEPGVAPTATAGAYPGATVEASYNFV